VNNSKLFDKDLLYECCKEVLLDMSFNSSYLHENLTFQEHVVFCDNIKNMSYEKLVSIVFREELEGDAEKIRDFESTFSKFKAYGLAMLAGGAAGTTGAAIGGSKLAKAGYILAAPAIGVFAQYMYRKMNDPCYRSCNNAQNQNSCKHECQMNAAKKMLSSIKSETYKCNRTKNPIKCEAKLNKLYVKWVQKYEKQRHSLLQARERDKYRS